MVITPHTDLRPRPWRGGWHCNTTCTTLVVKFMKKPDRPRATMSRTRLADRAMYFSRSRRRARRPVRNFSAHTAEQACAITVASAAP